MIKAFIVVNNHGMRSNPRVVAISFALAPALVRPSLVHSLNRSLPPFFLRLAAMVRLCRFYEQLRIQHFRHLGENEASVLDDARHGGARREILRQD